MPPSLVGMSLALALMVAAGICNATIHPQPHLQLPPQHDAQKQQQQQQALQPSPEGEAFFERCDQQQPEHQLDWVKYGNGCYRWFEEPKYWYVAEKACQALSGHLVSVANLGENRFLAKLTYCRAAWVGGYAVDCNLMTQANNIRWSDGTPNQYHDPFNITDARLHYPLIYSKDSNLFNSVYHQQHSYVCKVPSLHRNYTCNCPTGWKAFNGHCYFMPHFTATYIEGDYYCRGENAHLVSVHSAAELRALSLLDIHADGCPAETWIGLVKLNPCRQEYSTNSGPICYRWSDRTGDHNAKSLQWAHGQPINDLTTNCVLLKDREIQTVPCHTRARFVCKKKAGQ